ncbi:MAG: metalloprotease TldD [Gammaproteobacteria bacterium]|nr:metalloprotease TldD [Gammaproteobacteria bacterium]MBU1653942.1 metalloprotease TldD [Gammaproteobacteria bacterium]MBU1962642.1 metalloprotease TldD [Gammaproteobacteria bacterium]
MTDNLDIARNIILSPNGILDDHIEQALGLLCMPDVDLADIYFQHSRLESWVLEDGIVKEGAFSIEKGVGLRAVSGEKTGFAYSDDIDSLHLVEAARAASSIVHSGQGRRIAIRAAKSSRPLYTGEDPLLSLDREAKIGLLRRVDEEARNQDPRINQVIVSLVAAHEVVLIAADHGGLSADIRPLVRMNVSVIAEQDGRREQGGSGGGARELLHFLLDEERCLDYARDASRQALINLEAVAAPAGTMTVVLGPGWPGVLLHEAVGHGLEGDFNRKGSSAFAGRLGEQVASSLCTVVDDGAMPGRRGSLRIDDEGTPTQRTVLIENGLLKGYMQDRHNARLMGVAPTGNGRRESYAHLPMPRMTNTYMLAGQSDPADIIASVGNGIYAVNFGGGQVDITSGKFVFSASEAYLIEKGKIGRPVKGATLIGNGPEVLTRVTMVGNDLQLDQGIGVCGKEGQSVPVGVGQPTLRVEQLTVGGTNA